MNAVPPVIDTVIFDLDGTLIDSYEAFYQICKSGCEAAGHPVPDRESLFPVMNEGVSFFDLCFPPDLPNRELVTETFRQEARKVRARLMAQHVRLMDGMPELIRQLHPHYKLAIVTSSERDALEPIVHAGVMPCFQSVVTREDVSVRKPHPEGILKALKDMGSDPASAIMVGDTPMDIMAGRKAGTQTAGIRSNTDNHELLRRLEPDVLFSTLSEIGVWLKLDSARTRLTPSVMLQGVYCSGLGKAAEFLALDWVRYRLESMTGFTAFPGTFNVDLLPASNRRLKRFRQLRDREARLLTPEPGFCESILYPCKIQHVDTAADAYALFPLIDGYPSQKLEIIAPIRLQEQLKVNDDSEVQIMLYT